MNSNDGDIEKEISLIENFYKYLKFINKNQENITNHSTGNSIYGILIEYYNERIDYDSDYFDPYAYVNDMNDDILEREELDTFYLIQHFIDYLTKIIKGDNTELATIDSLYRIIKFYYHQRIILQSNYFDSYAYTNDLNDVLQDLDISDLSEIESESEDENASQSNEMNTESESSSDSESEPEDVEIKLVDPYLSTFVDNDVNKSDILLYQVNSKPIEKLEHFLNLNKFY